MTRRSPRSAAASAIGVYATGPAGVPPCMTRGRPSAGPVARTSSRRPSARYTVNVSAVMPGTYLAACAGSRAGARPWHTGRSGRSGAVLPRRAEVLAVTQRRHGVLAAAGVVDHDDPERPGAADRGTVRHGPAEVDGAEVGQRQHAAATGGRRLGDDLGRGVPRATERLVDDVKPVPGLVADNQGVLASAGVGDPGFEVVAWPHAVGEVHRERREHLVPGEVLGRAPVAIHLGPGLLDGAAVGAVDADPEAGELAAGAVAVGRRLGPVSRDALELAAGCREPGPVKGGRRDVRETVADHRPRSGRPDQVDGGPDEMPGHGRARRVPGRNRRSGGRDRTDDQGKPGEGYAPST